MDKEAVFQLAHTIHQQLLSAQQDSNQMDMEIVWLILFQFFAIQDILIMELVVYQFQLCHHNVQLDITQMD